MHWTFSEKILTDRPTEKRKALKIIAWVSIGTSIAGTATAVVVLF